MTDHEIATSRPLVIAEALAVVGMLFFIATLVLEPIIGLPDWAALFILIAGIAVWLVAAILLRGRSADFARYLSIGKDKELALWRRRPFRQSAPIVLILFFSAVILFRNEWSPRADQIAAIGIAIIALSEVLDRCVNAVRSGA